MNGHQPEDHLPAHLSLLAASCCVSSSLCPKTLQFHTDGLTESMDQARKQLEKEIPEALTRKQAGKPDQEILNSVGSGVARPVAGAAQRDDRTLLAIQLTDGVRVQVSIPATPQRIERRGYNNL
jgi:hypothetical protein